MDYFSLLLMILAFLSGLAYICSLFLSFIPRNTVLLLCSFLYFFSNIYHEQRFVEEEHDKKYSPSVYVFVFTMLSFFPLLITSGGGFFRIILATDTLVCILLIICYFIGIFIEVPTLPGPLSWIPFVLLVAVFGVSFWKLSSLLPFLLFFFVLWTMFMAFLRYYKGLNFTAWGLLYILLLAIMPGESFEEAQKEAAAMFEARKARRKEKAARKEEEKRQKEEARGSEVIVDAEVVDGPAETYTAPVEEVVEAEVETVVDVVETEEIEEVVEDVEEEETEDEEDWEEEDIEDEEEDADDVEDSSQPQVKWVKDHWVLVYPEDKPSQKKRHSRS